MGVPGLWDVLRPAAARHSLSHLAREAVLTNKNNLRALTIGIDASIWIFHAQLPTQGENPFLRTIFFKITSLLQQPVLPVFVFDGPDKPKFKRGSKVGGSFGTSDARSRQFKELLDECGLEWWNAPGEAEAELAVMNRQGKIDAVLSDDVDALLFGATCLMRNNSPTLSGAQANSAKGNDRQYDVYRMRAIQDYLTSIEGSELKTEEDCRLAMIFIALLAGGDYVPEGLDQFGPTIATALAHAGFAEVLKLYKSDVEAFKTEISFTHGRIVDELRSNSKGLIGRRYPDRAGKLSHVEPSLLFQSVALDAYLTPSTSPLADLSAGWPGFGRGDRSIRRGKARNEGRGDLEGFAKACERFFEWGTRDMVVKKFAAETTGIFGSELMNTARETIRRSHASTSPRSRSPEPTSPVTPVPSSQVASSSRITAFFPEVYPSSRSKPTASTSLRPTTTTEVPKHVIKICGTRDDPTDPGRTEYRIAYEHEPYSTRVRRAMTGDRVDPKDLDADMRRALGLVDKDKDEAATAAALKDEQRLWLGDYLVKEAWPSLAEAYEAEVRAKGAKDAVKKKRAESGTQKKSTKKAADTVPPAPGMNSQAFRGFFTAPSATQQVVATASQGSTSSSAALESDDSDIEFVETPVLTRATTRPKTTSRKIHPTSSMSSLSSASPDSPPASPAPVATRVAPARRTRAAVAVTAVKPRATRSTSKSLSTPVAASKIKSKAKSSAIAAEIIDLCSSSDDATPRPARRATSVLSPTSIGNILPSPAPSTRRSPRSPKKKSKPVSESILTSQVRQTKLDLPVFKPAAQPAKKAASPRATRSPSRKSEHYFKVESETDEEIHIDTTGTGALRVV